MKGIVPDDILEALKKKKLGLPGIDTDPLPEKNALVMGEFNVIKALIEKHPEAKLAKAQVNSEFVFLEGLAFNKRENSYSCYSYGAHKVAGTFWPCLSPA